MKETLLFAGKKLLSKALYPVGAVLVLWISGLIIRRCRPNSSVGMLLIWLGGILLVVMSSPITSYLLIQPLESRAGPYADPQELTRKGVRFIVVLGGGVVGENLSPADGAGSGLLRVMEGTRLCRRVPGSRLVLLQEWFSPGKIHRQKMAELPKELGISQDDLILEGGAWDTADEAAVVQRIVGQEPFALVTSAYHMPRALMTFQRLRLQPLPAPCEYFNIKAPGYLQWIGIDAMPLLRSQLAMHEYLGMLWLTIKQKLFTRAEKLTLDELPLPGVHIQAVVLNSGFTAQRSSWSA